MKRRRRAWWPWPMVLLLAGCGGEVMTAAAAVPCATAGGVCAAPQACPRGAGTLGAGASYDCAGSRRICCLATCAGMAETIECCNRERTYAPRPLCDEGALRCPRGFTPVPIGACLAR